MKAEIKIQKTESNIIELDTAETYIRFTEILFVFKDGTRKKARNVKHNSETWLNIKDNKITICKGAELEYFE